MIYLKQLKVAECAESNEYPYNMNLFKMGFEIKFSKKVTIIIGENGCGKSTIMKYIAENIGFNISGGNSNSNYDSFHQLNHIEQITLGWQSKTKKGFYFRSDTFDSYYKYIETDAQISRYYNKKFSQLSHGESFLELFSHFREGIFLLDEPESSLSCQNQLALLRIMYELEKSNKAQIIILTHSPIIMSYPNADVLLIDHDTISSIDYKTSDHYLITKQMINNPEGVFKNLFED